MEAPYSLLNFKLVYEACSSLKKILLRLYIEDRRSIKEINYCNMSHYCSRLRVNIFFFVLLPQNSS